MDKREALIHRWFRMWLEQNSRGIEEIFEPDALYIESYGPEYHGLTEIESWFRDWNQTGKVFVWDIHGFFHTQTQTAVSWYFKNRNAGGGTDEFDGMTLVDWSSAGKMIRLQEFGCNRNRYAPY